MNVLGRFLEETIYMLPSVLAKQTFFSIIVFVIVFFISFWLKSRQRYILIGLWALVFVRLVLPVDFASPISVRSAAEKLFTVIDNGRSSTSPASDTAVRVKVPVPGTDGGSKGELKESAFSHVLSLIWLTVASALLFLQIVRRHAVFREIRYSRVLFGGKWFRSVESWRMRLRLGRRVTIVCGRKKVSPFTTGLFKPVIYIPHALMIRGTDETIDSVIGHEMAHIKGCDALWSLVCGLLQIVYFFNPVVWIAGRQIRQIREYACDETAMQWGKLSRKTYGRVLLKVMGMNLAFGGTENSFEGFFNRKELITRRLHNLKQGIVPAKHKRAAVILVIALSVFILPLAAQTGRTVLPYAERMFFVSPVDNGIINLECGWDRKTENMPLYRHNGIDIRWSGTGTGAVYAAADGKVQWIVEDNLFPWCTGMMLSHKNDFKTCYFHLGTTVVKPGEYVRKGRLLGYVDASIGALHFEVHRNMTVLDPELYLSLPKQLTRSVIKFNSINPGESRR